MKRIHLVVIDPQNSFCQVVPENEQQLAHTGELCVAGGWDDMVRLAAFIKAQSPFIERIHLTLDSHHLRHISHPCWFQKKDGAATPKPFTMMKLIDDKIIGHTLQDGLWVPEGEYEAVIGGYWTKHYLRTLQAGDRYPHIIWPYHCLIGTPGNNVVSPLMEAVLGWELLSRCEATKIIKGTCSFVEQFSAIQSDVQHDDALPVNHAFLRTLQEADEVLIAGEALSHCVANTVRDMATYLGTRFLQKCVLLRDATSPVTGFEQYAEAFLDEMKKHGMKEVTTMDYDT